MSLQTNTSKEIREAQQLSYAAVLHRYPTALEAYSLGFAVGIREDYNLFEGDKPCNVDLEIQMLDNDFRDPDVDRYLEEFEKHDPSVAVIGDAYTRTESEEFQSIVEELRDSYPHKKYIVVPKCRQAFEELDDEVVLGYPLGYSDLDPGDFSILGDWRGRDTHILGGSPEDQWSVIQDLTQPTIQNLEPGNVVGVDSNFFSKAAYFGEYWTPSGYEPADHLSIRETVRRSLEEIKSFWQSKGVWPETEPRELYGSAVERPEFDIFMDQGGDPIPDRESLENAVVQEYEDYGKMAFSSEHSRKRWEYYEGLEPV